MSISTSLITFFTMGGYADIVWPAWGITLIVLIYNIMIPRIKTKQLRKMIANSPRPKTYTEFDNSQHGNDTNGAN